MTCASRGADSTMTIFVRPRAWWYNKVPLSVLLLLLLVDARPLTGAVIAALVGLVAAVCSVANYGYALNELFDREEDRRAGRRNAADIIGRRGMWTIICLSAAAAGACATAAAGPAGLALTAGALLLPLAYSVPPLRIKERGWLGVWSDAAAAHVYPAMLALAIVSTQSLRTPTRLLVLTAGLWSAAAGLRGILSHQLQSEERDRGADLLTVVHRLGRARVATFVVWCILPIEVAAFASLLVQSDATALVALIACGFVCYEAVKFGLDVYPVAVFTPAGEPYIPFVDDSAYKVWGPLALSIDAAFADPYYLALTPLYVLLFRPLVAQESRRIRVVGRIFSTHVHSFAARLRGPYLPGSGRRKGESVGVRRNRT